MKKLISFLLVLVALFALCGCGEVKKCEEAIDAIGTISNTSRDISHVRYKDALAAYNALTDAQKGKVGNVELLTEKTAEFEKAVEQIDAKEKAEEEARKQEKELRDFEQKVKDYVLSELSETIKTFLATPSSFKVRTDKKSIVSLGIGVTPQSNEVTGLCSIYFSSTNAFGGTVDDEITVTDFSFKNDNGVFSDFNGGIKANLWVIKHFNI